MAELWDIVAPTLCRLVPPGSRVLVATSGGPDSQALLDLVAGLRARCGLAAVYAAGVDHGLRPAARDELAVAAALAAARDVPFSVLPVEVEREGNVLANARRARYRALLAHARAIGADAVAVAHTATDQAETVLFHLARGAGLVGAGGMRERRGLVVRPLLGVTRPEILEHLESRGIAFARDPSNEDPRRARALLRARVLPALEALNPGAVRNLARFAARARRDEDTLSALAARRVARFTGPAGELAAAALRGRHGVRTLRAWLALGGDEPSGSELARVLSLRREGARARLAGSSVVLARGAYWRERPRPSPRPLDVPGRLELPELGVALVSRIEDIAPGSYLARASSTTRVAFDADRLHLPLQVRSAQPGERVRPFGLQGSTKLGDLFTNLKMPTPLRGSWPVVATDGEIAWVIGLRRAAGAAVTAETRRILVLEVDGPMPWSAC